MSSEFRKVKLKDIASFKYGKTIRKQDIQSCGEYPVFSGYQVVGYLPGYMYKEEQLIIVCRGAGGTGDIKMSPSFCSITNLAIIISCDDKIIDKGYLYWRLILSDTYSLRTGSAQPQITINTLESFEIDIEPNLKKQREIARILFNINNKIRNNVDINQTLEQMAQALFKSWFVDFEPVKAKIAVLEAGGSQDDATLAAMTAISGKDADALAFFEREHPEQYAELKATAELFPSAMQESEQGEIPEGWSLGNIKNCIDIINGYAFKSPDYTSEGVFVLRTKNFHSNHYVERLDDDVFLPRSFLKEYSKYNCEPYDYHMVMVGASIGHSAIIYPHSLPALRNQNMWCFRPKKISFVGKAYTKTILDKIIGELKGFASGSAREFFRKGDFENKEIVLANKELHDFFEILCFPYIEMQGALCAQSEHLSQLRDTLLPKLLSGEITLPEAEQIISEEA
ncbi:restriction endonuclease subunit S [Klebsiella quasivariicola]|uniref:restriction endonuclease subunit S n=1 Tax=Klebsiella quasivariicola TaxID=2026240 RepID=UPI001181F5D6|nr:restriction endonuclease subunit S [Klebsiella quasivariicola]TTM52229.1 restriction endonuclease subunit S [Klebsiella quasivariicola]